MNDGTHGKRLVRSREGRLVAGVCAGLAVYFGLDANIIRLIFAGLTAFVGVGALLYVMAWFIVSEEGEPESIAENLINKTRS